MIVNVSNIIGFVLFAFVTSVTPGPNNLLLFRQGKRCGLKGTGMLMAGISFGFSSMLILTGLGLGKLFVENKTVYLVLKIIGSIWLLYLAISIAFSKESVSDKNTNIYGFYKGFFMQYVNPKAWVMAISCTAAYIPTNGNIYINVLVYTVLFAIIGLPCMILWAKLGDIISLIINTDRVHDIVNYILGFLLVISVVLMWFNV